jgi:hypothetical protein
MRNRRSNQDDVVLAGRGRVSATPRRMYRFQSNIPGTEDTPRAKPRRRARKPKRGTHG